MPMTEHTKAVLEAATGQLVALGMTRRRRGLATWRLNDEMVGGIGVVATVRGSIVSLVLMPQMVWEPVEQLVAHGNGEVYDPWDASNVTRSEILAPTARLGPIEFETPVVDGRMLDRVKRLAAEDGVNEVLNLADERSILSHFRANAPRGGGRAEHALAVRAWQTRSLDLGYDYEKLYAVQSRLEHRQKLQLFHHRLTGSDEVRAFLTGQGAVIAGLSVG